MSDINKINQNKAEKITCRMRYTFESNIPKKDDLKIPDNYNKKPSLIERFITLEFIFSLVFAGFFYMLITYTDIRNHIIDPFEGKDTFEVIFPAIIGSQVHQMLNNSPKNAPNYSQYKRKAYKYSQYRR